MPRLKHTHLPRKDFFIYIDVFNGALLRCRHDVLMLKAYVRLADKDEVLEHIMRYALTKYKIVTSDVYIDEAAELIRTLPEYVE